MTRLAGFSEAVGCTRPSIVLESRPLCVGTCGQRCMVPVIHLYPTKDVTNAPGALTTDVGGGEPDADHTTLSAIRERAACCPVRKTRADMCLGGGRRDFVTRGWWDSAYLASGTGARPLEQTTRPNRQVRWRARPGPLENGSNRARCSRNVIKAMILAILSCIRSHMTSYIPERGLRTHRSHAREHSRSGLERVPWPLFRPFQRFLRPLGRVELGCHGRHHGHAHGSCTATQRLRSTLQRSKRGAAPLEPSAVSPRPHSRLLGPPARPRHRWCRG